jgi:hypothetical protein
VHPPSIGARRIPENPTDVECIESMGATAEFAACFDIAALFGRMMGILTPTGRGIRAVAKDAYEGAARPAAKVPAPVRRQRQAFIAHAIARIGICKLPQQPRAQHQCRSATDQGIGKRVRVTLTKAYR